MGTVRKETPTVWFTASESGMLGKQTQNSGVLNYQHPSRSLFSSASDDVAAARVTGQAGTWVRARL